MDVQRSGGRSRSSLAQINVTPLVDVMLVLLIIFMVTAPMMEQGLDVNLPKVDKAGELATTKEPLVVTVTRDRGIAVSGNRVENVERLGAVLRQMLSKTPEREVFLEADEGVAYGRVVEVMAAVRAAGVSKLGMVTEPR